MCVIIYIWLLKTNNGFSFYNYMSLTTTLIFMDENCVEKKDNRGSERADYNCLTFNILPSGHDEVTFNHKVLEWWGQNKDKWRIDKWLSML